MNGIVPKVLGGYCCYAPEDGLVGQLVLELVDGHRHVSRLLRARIQVSTIEAKDNKTGHP